jgi:hypothetical protein
LLANIVYGVSLIFATWAVIPLCQAGIYRLTGFEPSDD